MRVPMPGAHAPIRERGLHALTLAGELESTQAFALTFVGTTCYMSPERLSGEAYSYPADIWALGIILLELATGKFPYKKPESYFQLCVLEGWTSNSAERQLHAPHTPMVAC